MYLETYNLNAAEFFFLESLKYSEMTSIILLLTLFKSSFLTRLRCATDYVLEPQREPFVKVAFPIIRFHCCLLSNGAEQNTF